MGTPQVPSTSTVALLCVAALSAGCQASSPTFARAAADSASLIFGAGRVGVESHDDPALVGAGLPSIILNMEAIHRVIPEDHVHAVALVRTYCQYIEGWLVEDEARALPLARYAREIGLDVMRSRHRKVDEWLKGDLEDLQRYLGRRYRGERSAELLFWTAKAWTLVIELDKTEPATWELAALDAMVTRATVISPALDHGAAQGLLGQLQVWLAEDGRGSLEQARESFERGLSYSERQNAALLSRYANTYAKAAGDADLRTSLLEEALSAESTTDTLRLSNEVARAKVRRQLQVAD